MRIVQSLCRILAAGLLATALGAAHAGPAATKPAAKPDEAKPSGAGAKNQQFDDWGYRCDTPAGATAESCTILQIALHNAQAEGGQQQWLLQTAIGYVDGQEKPAMIVKARLGVMLPPGVVFTVPGHQPVKIPFQRCDENGCVASILLDEPFVKAMRDGDAAAQKDPGVRGTVAITLAMSNAQGGVTGQRAVALPMSLKGFNAAFGKLKAPNSPATAAAETEPKKDAGKKDGGKKKK